jgi:hypothetical protein
MNKLKLYFSFFFKKRKPFQLVRKDIDVNEHNRLSNITLRHKLK